MGRGRDGAPSLQDTGGVNAHGARRPAACASRLPRPFLCPPSALPPVQFGVSGRPVDFTIPEILVALSKKGRACSNALPLCPLPFPSESP